MPIQEHSTLPHQTGRWKNQHFMNDLTNVLSNMLKILDVSTKNCPNQGAALLFDGHSSHISYRILKLAMENNIHIVKLPSHLTDKIQPLDRCVFGPIKSCWGKKLISHGKKQIEKRGDTRLKRTEFSALLGEVWKESMLSKK